MSLGVLNNISAIYAQNNLNQTQASLQNTLTQLSSGSRINSGADDAAGLALADGLHANVAALTQSSQNASAGVGMAIYQRVSDPHWIMLGRTQAAQFWGRSSGMFGIPNSFAGLLELMIPVCGALLFSDDQLVLCLFESGTREAVRAASVHLGIPCERVIDSVWIEPGGLRRRSVWEGS